MLSLQRDLLTHFKCVTNVCDKRFLLTLMFADCAIEPFYYERGVNLYENGQNYALASLLSIVGPTLLGQAAYEKLLAAFQNAVKETTADALKALVYASPAVQVADVMIGAAIEAANNFAGLRSGGPDPEAVLSLYAERQFIHMIPSEDFEEQRRFRQGTQAADIIDYFSANFFASREG